MALGLFIRYAYGDQNHLPMEKHTITLTPEDVAQLTELGGGYLSRGIREALRRLNGHEAH